MKGSVTPLISVVMGSFNSSEFIREAIESILNQTITDFEFIIIDDCSTDDTINIIKSYNDPRIILVQNEENKGLGYGLNIGVSMSRGKYIARMDADDVSMPDRFEKQLSYLKNHADTLLVGSYVKLIGLSSLYGRIFYGTIGKKQIDIKRIRVSTLIGAAFYHPTVMFNGDLLRRKGYNYSPSFSKAQDYELWSRVVWDNEVANIPEPLLCYRRTKGQATVACRCEQLNNSEIIFSRIFKDILKIDYNSNQIQLYRKFISAGNFSVEAFPELWSLMMGLNSRVHQLGNLFDEEYYHSFFDLRLIDYCRHNLKISDRLSFYLRHSLVRKRKLLRIVRLYLDF